MSPRLRRSLPAVAGCCVAAVVLVGGSSGCGAGGHAGLKAARVGAATTAPSLGPPQAIALSTGWRYRADPYNVGLGRRWWLGPFRRGWSAATIPNDFNTTVSDASFAGTVGWYELSFTGPRSPGWGWQLQFQGVRRDARVWLNGRQLGASSDPYAPFTLPAGNLVAVRANVLVVRVDNVVSATSFPQDWWNWGGIVRPVTLAPVGRASLTDLGVMPRLGCRYRCARLLIEGTLSNDAPTPLSPAIAVTTVSPSGVESTSTGRQVPLAPGASSAVSFSVPVTGPAQLWSPARPALYSVRVRVLLGARVQQSSSLRVGLREVQTSNGILYLNGSRLWLHGAAIHEDVQGSGAALTEGDIDTIVAGLRAVGANITRAHYPLSEQLLDALDTAGILVWSQAPVDHADAQLQSASGRAQALAMLRATVIAQRSHPSVVVDSVGNELSPTPDANPGTHAYLMQATELARRLDPDALVALDAYAYPGYPAQQSYDLLDVLGLSEYWGWYGGPPGHAIGDLGGLAAFLRTTHSRYPDKALAISEFGAEGLFDGPADVKGTYEFQADYLRRTYAILDQLPFLNGAIYWTLREFAVQPGWIGGAQLPAGYAPDGLHHKGLIAYDGTEKPAFAVAQQLFATEPSFVRESAATG